MRFVSIHPSIHPFIHPSIHSSMQLLRYTASLSADILSKLPHSFADCPQLEYSKMSRISDLGSCSCSPPANTIMWCRATTSHNQSQVITVQFSHLQQLTGFTLTELGGSAHNIIAKIRFSVNSTEWQEFPTANVSNAIT